MSSLSSLDQIACQVLDTFFNYRIRYSNIPGYQVSIRKKGELIFNKAYGYANADKEEVYTPKHLGRIASQSKVFTAALVFILQEKGRLTLHDKIVDYLPEFKKHKDKRFKDITIRDLVTNRSGIFRDGVDSSFWDLEKPFLGKRELMKEVLQENLVYEPNTVTKYSNVGFSLLGPIIEKAGGDSYANLVQKHIVSKLSIKGFYPDYDKNNKKLKFAQGHTRAFYKGERKIMPHTTANSYIPAAGFCSNTENTTNFLYELYFTDKILPEHIRKDLRYLSWPVKDAKGEFYGLGTQMTDVHNTYYVGHSGGYPGFISQTRHVIGTDYIFGFILNTNEYLSFLVIRSMYEVIQKIKASFLETELKDVIVSKPIMDKWGSSVYLVGKKKVLSFSLEGWLLTEGAAEFAKKADGHFYCDTQSGYFSPGEPLKITMSGKTIKSVKSGSFTSYEEKEFLRRSRKNIKI